MTDLTSRFDFAERIGAGGWAQVWKAKDRILRRHVAIKLFEPGGSTFSSAWEHAQALARVNHINVVHLYEVGTCAHPETLEQWNAIIMELLSGPTLQSVYQLGLTADQAIKYSFGLLDGLEALHNAGIAHTDLHSGNIMLHNDTPKLLDVLYRGTLATQPELQRQTILKLDLKQAITEVAALLTISEQGEVAADFRRNTASPRTVADLRQALERATTIRSSQVSSHNKNQSEETVPRSEPTPQVEVLSWHSQCLDRFQEALSGSEQETSVLYKRGHWSVAYTLPSNRIAPADLLSKLQSVRGWTGWRPWWVPSREGWRPYSKQGKIECWIKHMPASNEPWQRTPATADFWLASPDASFFVLRGFDEDSNPKSLPPGSALSAYMPMWRLGECIFHATQMHNLLNCQGTPIDFSVKMKGLMNRVLVYWPSPFGPDQAGDSSHEDSFEYKISFEPPSKVTAESLYSILHEPLDLLFEQFAFAKVDRSVYLQEFRKMMRGN